MLIITISIACLIVGGLSVYMFIKLNKLQQNYNAKIKSVQTTIQQYNESIGSYKSKYQGQFILLNTLKQLNRGMNVHTQMLNKLIVLLQNYGNKQSYQYEVLVTKLSKQLKQHIRISRNYGSMMEGFIKIELQKKIQQRLQPVQ